MIRLFVSVLVLEIVGITTLSTIRTPAAERARVVSEASPILTAVNCGESDVVSPTTAACGRPVQLVKTPEVGVPRSGVVNCGEVAKTRRPEPVSSVMAEARFALEGVVRNVKTFDPRFDAIIMFEPSIETTPAETLVKVVSVA